MGMRVSSSYTSELGLHTVHTLWNLQSTCFMQSIHIFCTNTRQTYITGAMGNERGIYLRTPEVLIKAYTVTGYYALTWCP